MDANQQQQHHHQTPVRRDRNFLSLELGGGAAASDASASTDAIINFPQPPLLEIQSPKTPTLSRKLKAVSLDSDPPVGTSTSLMDSTGGLQIAARDVFSMPNTPKRQIKHKLSCEFDSGGLRAPGNSPCFSLGSASSTMTTMTTSNLKKFASNSSISGSQTLKTLPEIMMLHDFSSDDCGGKDSVGTTTTTSTTTTTGTSKNETPVIKMKTKGLLERRGSNASLTIDLGAGAAAGGSGSGLEKTPLTRLNAARSVSNLNLTSFGATGERCTCYQINSTKTPGERRKSQETCGNCTIYESVPSKGGKVSCCSCSAKCRRKSLSNENLYVPPCCGGYIRTCGRRGCGKGGAACGRGRCGGGGSDEATTCTTGATYAAALGAKGYHKKAAYYPRQPDLNNTLSDDFKRHLQNVEYLQTAGNVLSVDDLASACEVSRVPKLHSEFWEVPLNLQEKCYVSGSQSRNRYKGVLPNEHSRVHLPESQNYIHANYIKGPDYTETAYIATQGPMTHTCQDFWDMVWHTNSTCIVMLTGLVEKGRSKCELYFPLGKKSRNDPATKSFFYVKTTRERDKFSFGGPTVDEEETLEFEELDVLTYGDYTIRHVSQELLDECVIRHLELIKKHESKTVRHYWFPNWQDHKMANPEQLLKMAMHILKFADGKVLGEGGGTVKRSGDKSERRKSDGKCSSAPPTVVHCSAGIGRTGCFLAILNGIQQLHNGGNVDVLAILCSLRLNRGGMVQTAEQYELIHRVLNLYTGRGISSGNF